MRRAFSGLCLWWQHHSPLLSSAQHLSSHKESSTRAGMPWVGMCDPVASPQQTQATHTCLRALWRVRKSTPKVGRDTGQLKSLLMSNISHWPGNNHWKKRAFSAGRRSFVTLKERRTRSTENPVVHLDGVSLPAPVESTRVFQKCLPAPFITYTECMASLSKCSNKSLLQPMDKGHRLTFCFAAKLPPPKFSLCKAMAIRQSHHHEVRAFSSRLDLAMGKSTEGVRSSLWLCLCTCWPSSMQSYPSNTIIFFTSADPVWTHFLNAKRVAVGVMLVITVQTWQLKAELFLLSWSRHFASSLPMTNAAGNLFLLVGPS